MAAAASISNLAWKRTIRIDLQTPKNLYIYQVSRELIFFF